MKKAFIISIAFLVLGIVFFFSEERHDEGQSEVNYWKINPEEIRYYAPKESKEFSKFIKGNLAFRKIETGLKTAPIFSVKGTDSESKAEFLYEGSYNVKNLFTELSYVTTKSINKSTPELLEKFSVSLDTSPYFELYNSSKLERKFYLGEENRDKTQRYVLSENDLITAQSQIFQKFTLSEFDFRDRQYLHFGESDLVRISFQLEGIRLSLENNPETKNGIQYSRWFKILNGKSRVDPTIAGGVVSNLQSFRAELYPDSPEGEGFAVAKELVSTESYATLEIFLINGLHYKIKLFPKVVLKNKSYYPVIKEVEKFFLESPSYTSEDTILQIIELIKKIQSDPEWTEPKGK